MILRHVLADKSRIDKIVTLLMYNYYLKIIVLKKVYSRGATASRMRVRYINIISSLKIMEKEFISLSEFIPSKVTCGEQQKEFPISIKESEDYFLLSYTTHVSNQYGRDCGNRKYSLMLPKIIRLEEKTFEVLGLLQAEMGKTNNGALVFTNHEPRLINAVVEWFEKEFELIHSEWRWYTKVNVNEPEDLTYKQQVEDKVVNYWLSKTKIKKEMSHPKSVVYTKETKNKKLGFYDYGTLILEYKNNLFSQIIKKLVRDISYETYYRESKFIRSFMKGILAGESSVEVNKKWHKYVVHITSLNKFERDIYQKCLQKLGIECKQYDDYKDLIISKRENNIQLLKQRLMTLSPEKYAKFLSMMKLYPNIKYETDYFKPKGKNAWNKIPEEKIERIIELYKTGTTRTKDIAEQLEISKIKVNRVLKENNLGKRVITTPEEKRKEIAQFTKENPSLNLEKIAEHFKVHVSVVKRAYQKYYGKRGMKANCKIPEEKIQRIVAIYKENPTVKFSEIMKELNISSTVIKRARMEHNLDHLGFKHLIGNNNKKAGILNLR